MVGPLATASRRTTPISTPRGGVINLKGKTTKEKITTTRVLRGGPHTTKTTKKRANGAPKADRRATRQHLPTRQTRPDYPAEALEPTQ